jgi:hypothetical protein
MSNLTTANTVSSERPYSWNYPRLESETVRKIRYVVLAVLILALAVAACFVSPYIAGAITVLSAAVSFRLNVIYYTHHTEELQESIRSIKYYAYKALGVFSRHFTEKAATLKLTKPREEIVKISLLRRVGQVFLNVLYAGLYTGSFLVNPLIARVLSAGCAFISTVQWLDHTVINKPSNHQITF